MRVTIYKCNECKKEIGNKIHLSLHFATGSGVAVPPGAGIHMWRVESYMQGQFLHFCGINCLSKYFGNLMANSDASKKKEKPRS
jgi:hypothetical protein